VCTGSADCHSRARFDEPGRYRMPGRNRGRHAGLQDEHEALPLEPATPVLGAPARQAGGVMRRASVGLERPVRQSAPELMTRAIRSTFRRVGAQPRRVDLVLRRWKAITG
jgi:hypothetical protein